MALFQVDFTSQTLKRSVSLNVLIPADPNIGMPLRDNGPYKTLYLLHGVTGDCMKWLTLANTMDYSQLYNLAIVMPSGERSYYLDIGNSDRMYSKFIGGELVEFTRRVFPLSHSREDTFIGGQSMGGYGALYNGLKYNGVFSRIISLSTSILVNRMEEVSRKPNSSVVSPDYYREVAGGDFNQIKNSDKNLEVLAKQVLDSGENVPAIYLACGYNDALVYGNRKFSDYLTGIGYKHYYEEGAGTHDFAFWSEFLQRGIDCLGLGEKVAAVSPYWVDAKNDSPNPVT